jgi:two-component system, LuxR family, response regulator FixJ
MRQRSILHVIDDDTNFLSAMTFMASGLKIETKTYESAEAFLKMFIPGISGCALVDLNLPDLNGIGLQARLKELDPDLPFIMITGYADIPSAVAVASAGAFGFLEKPVNAKELTKMIRAAMRHSTSRNPVRAARKKLEELSSREREVFNLVVQGYTNQGIAEHIDLDIKTVEGYRSSMKRTMGAEGLQDLIAIKDRLSRSGAA